MAAISQKARDELEEFTATLDLTPLEPPVPVPPSPPVLVTIPEAASLDEAALLRKRKAENSDPDSDAMQTKEGNGATSSDSTGASAGHQAPSSNITPATIAAITEEMALRAAAKTKATEPNAA